MSKAIHFKFPGELKPAPDHKYIFHIHPKPRLFTSFSNRMGTLVSGVLFLAFGLFMIPIYLSTGISSFWDLLVIAVLLVSIISGIWLTKRAICLISVQKKEHTFLYYNESFVISGSTTPIGQDEFKMINIEKGANKIHPLLKYCASKTEIKIVDIQTVKLKTQYGDRATLNHFIIIGRENQEITFDISKILPSFGLNPFIPALCFNSISEYYTNATGKPINAVLDD